MIIAVRAYEWQKQAWLQKPAAPGIEIIWAENDQPAADAYFDLCYEELGAIFTVEQQKPLFLNAVIDDLSALPKGVSRINAWPVFFENKTIEIVPGSENAVSILHDMGWDFVEVVDRPGMVTARTVSMIINEAYFALGEEVSSKEEIDTAMKLGTNYPHGPFEWADKIGLHRVFRLLSVLASTDLSYTPAPLLASELKSPA